MIAYAALALEDGTVFVGESFGADNTVTGEVVFNTAMAGYQEILTDPSYCGQIVTMTAPQIGNYGVNTEDIESRKQHLSGFVVKELSRRVSNQRATDGLSDYLRSAGIVGLTGIDTRALTRRLRVHGALRGAISTRIREPSKLVALARSAPSMEGSELVSRVAPSGEAAWEKPDGPVKFRVFVFDCGIKQNILRMLQSLGCEVTAVPPHASAESLLERKPHGILVGNGPGDPAAVTATIQELKKLIGRVPIFGICLGHQLLGLALGAKTYKLKFGHHGVNHPVLNLDSSAVEITSQNHGFAVDADSLSAVGARVTHVNLYDRSVEGFVHEPSGIFAVQYHPEACPGPRDSGYLFHQFTQMLDS